MDNRHSQGHYQGGQHFHGNQHQQTSNSPYPWSSNNVPPPYRAQAPPNSTSSIPPQNRIQNGGSMPYYNQAQGNHNVNTSSYGGASNQPYSNQQAYSQHSGNRGNNAPQQQYGQQVNPWGKYNQGQSYNATAQPPPPPPPNNSAAVMQAPGQSYNQYMYPPPGVPNQTNQNQGQNMSYTQPAVHAYYQMQQQSGYYYPPKQMYPPAVPPPPLPQAPPPPPQQSKKERPSSDNEGESSRECSSSSSRSEDRPSRSSPPIEKPATSSKDKRSSPQTVQEKEKEEKETKKAVPIMVGKRRGGRVLPTGVVKKQKVEDDNSKGKPDAWSQYMAEVRRYKDQSCTEERQNRPLVK